MRAIVEGKHSKAMYIWFEQFNSLSEIKRGKVLADFYIIHANQCPIKDKYVSFQKQNSLISYMDSDQESLFNSFTSTTKRQIRQAEREDVCVKLYTSEQVLLNEAVVANFAQMYTNMYEEKGIAGAKLPVQEIIAYAKTGNLVITAASISGAIVVYHSYVVEKTNSRLLHTCSEFRVEDSATRNAIGRANKYLHWKDMCYLKSIGVTNYDWGGITSFENPNGIDNFKMSFGGNHIEYFNVFITLSLKAKMLVSIQRLLKKNCSR